VGGPPAWAYTRLRVDEAVMDDAGRLTNASQCDHLHASLTVHQLSRRVCPRLDSYCPHICLTSDIYPPLGLGFIGLGYIWLESVAVLRKHFVLVYFRFLALLMK